MPMLEYESQLPKLPVNSLQATSDKWLQSIKPFTLDRGDKAGYERAERLAKDLVQNATAQRLQQRLEKRAETEDNWVIDCKAQSPAALPAYLGIYRVESRRKPYFAVDECCNVPLCSFE